MPVKEGPVGPFPPGTDPEEYDRLRRRVLWKMPSGLYVVGSRSGERRNLMTLNWASQMSFDPKWIAIGVEAEAYTHELITEGRTFTVNLISRDDRAIVRKFTKPVVVDLDNKTLNGFAFHDSAATQTPVLEQAVAFVDCAVRDTKEVGNHTIFFGEIVDCGFQQDEDTEVLRMEDTRMSYGG